MLLESKNAIIYGATGAVGGAVARTFAREGALVFLTGRDLGALDALAKEIATTGGRAETAMVDALDEKNVENHYEAAVRQTGKVDISFNAIGIPQQGMQGIPIAELSVSSFLRPVTTYTQAHFVTARAAVRRMAEQRSGVIMMHTAEPARLGIPMLGGMGPAWAALESLNRELSVEYAQYGVRAVCLRTTGMEETSTIDVVFGLHADALGITKEEFATAVAETTHRKRATTLDELAEVAAFVASDRAAGMTGTVANLTGGAVVD